MSATTRPAEDVVASVAKLTIAPASDSKKPKQVIKTNKSKKKEVADSWGDEDISSESDAEDSTADESRPSPATADLDGTKAPPPTPVSSDYKVSTGGTQAPPPTPINPSHQSAIFKDSQPSNISAALAARSVEEQKRPEKTDAAARRMIASALGVKVPRQTEEQKAYDKAMREKERKRREDEREAERKRLEEVEKAKRAVWED